MPDFSAPLLTLKQAEDVTGKARNTIKKRKAALIAAGATVDATGWSIPYPALVEVGLLDSVTPPDSVTDAQTDPTADLRAERDHWRAEAAKWEAVATERERTISVLQTVRALEAGQGWRSRRRARKQQQN